MSRSVQAIFFLIILGIVPLMTLSCGDDSTTASTSTADPGTYWTVATSDNYSYLTSVVRFESGPLYVACGSGGAIVTSTDAVLWTSQVSATKEDLLGIAANDNMIVAVGDNGTIVRSTDGITWTLDSSGVSGWLHGITWSAVDQQFVVVGNSGTVITSADGITWTEAESTTSANLYGVTAEGPRYVAVGGNRIIVSHDGIEWADTLEAVDYYLYDVVWSGSQYVSVGQKGTIMTSPDGIIWTSQTAQYRRSTYTKSPGPGCAS